MSRYAFIPCILYEIPDKCIVQDFDQYLCPRRNSDKTRKLSARFQNALMFNNNSMAWRKELANKVFSAENNSQGIDWHNFAVKIFDLCYWLQNFRLFQAVF